MSNSGNVLSLSLVWEVGRPVEGYLLGHLTATILHSLYPTLHHPGQDGGLQGCGGDGEEGWVRCS